MPIMKNIAYLLSFTFLMIKMAAAQTLTSSNLPVVVIDTQGETIKDEPKIVADMKIIDNGAAKRNNLTDAPNGYNGKIGIEYRGSTSQMFPKKPYGFETRDAKNAGFEVPLLGMPKEEDWILFASYNEKSLLNNAIAMKMARDMGVYASRTKHVELVVNGRYEGIYVLMERIKRGSGRVNISKMTDKDNAGDALTGGYIFKVDKTTGSGTGIGWNSKIPAPNNGRGQRIYYQYEYPKIDNITAQQRAYLTAVVDSAEAVLNSSSYLDKTNGYRKYFDPATFAKLFLVNEVSKNVDGYRISTFFHKDKNSKDRRIKAGPAWDYDLAFGNADYYRGNETTGWSYLMNDSNDNWQVPFHWKKMLEDPDFTADLSQQYTALRKGPWKTENLHAYVDSLAATLQEAQQRNFQRWPVLGVYIWPNPRPIATTWQGEINELKDWLRARLAWMDYSLPGTITSVEQPQNTISDLSVVIAPNPFADVARLRIRSPKPAQALLEVTDLTGRAVGNKFVDLTEGLNEVSVSVGPLTGVYLLRVHTAQGVISQKLVKQ
ncbi:MAG: T9SS C-terminal target domain-containing protein [Runella slithyformis]|nr:MAG: T9SS C-terminal target domain-containing protein [Runella slithyformis]